ncbi:unnamed protein product, partial [Effrenium voratum]
HPHLVKPLEHIDNMTLWERVQGLPWQAAMPMLSFSMRSKVVLQCLSVFSYCNRMQHVLWDLHPGDVLLRMADGPQLMLLDAYMEPDEILGRSWKSQVRNAGCLFMLPPELRLGGPARLQCLWQMPDPARRVNTYAAALFMASLACNLE